MPSSTDYPFSNAATSVQAYGSWDRVYFSNGPWTAWSTWTIAGTSSQGKFTFGVGYLGSDRGPYAFSSAFVMNNRVYYGQRNQLAFSAIGDPMGVNQQDSGAGFIKLQTMQGQQDSCVGLGMFQGRLVIFGRYNIQIWQTSANPAEFQLVQTLQSIGCIAAGSIQGLGGGDLDVLFLDDSGVRGLRTLVTTLNATVEDLGSPIDSLVLADIGTVLPSTIFSAVNPFDKRYIIGMGQKLYVYSYFPSAKIKAWSIYEARDSDLTLFSPRMMTIHEGQVIIRGDNNKLYALGGIVKGTLQYDGVTVTATTPWLDGKKPKTRKNSESIGAAFAGAWKIEAGMQPSTGTLRTVIQQGSPTTPTETVDSSLDLPVFPFTESGTHIQIKATSSTAGTMANPVKLSLLEWNYDLGAKE